MGIGGQDLALSGTGLATVPSIPTGLSAVATGVSGQANLSWAAPFNGGETTTSYTVTPLPACGSCSGLTVSGTPAPTSTTIKGLTNGTSYTFTVTASNSVGPGSPSLASNSVTPTQPVTVTVSGSQTYGSTNPTFTYVTAPTTTLGGALLCGAVDGGTSIKQALSAGSYTVDGASCSGLSASGDAITYTGENDAFVVAKANPMLSWTASSTITYGTSLGPAQLDASASVPGRFSYNPAAGTLLQPGLQTLTATFTPSDTTDYNGGSVTTTITIGFTQACITSAKSSPFSVTTGQSICVSSGGSLTGPVNVTSGGALWLNGGSITGPVTVSGARSLTFCGVRITGALSGPPRNYSDVI